MSGSALQQNTLEGQNVLMMPSARVNPGDDFTLTFRYNGGLFSAEAPADYDVNDFITQLTEGPYPFIVGQYSVSGNAVSIQVKARSSIEPQTAEAFFDTAKHVSGGFLSNVDYDLMQAIPAVLGHQAGAFSAHDAAAINENDPAYASPVARGLSNVSHAVTNTINSASAAAQSVTHTFIIIAVLILIGAGLYFAAPFLKAMGKKAA